jgi:hypothetical protein
VTRVELEVSNNGLMKLVKAVTALSTKDYILRHSVFAYLDHEPWLNELDSKGHVKSYPMIALNSSVATTVSIFGSLATNFW